MKRSWAGSASARLYGVRRVRAVRRNLRCAILCALIKDRGLMYLIVGGWRAGEDWSEWGEGRMAQRGDSEEQKNME